MKMPWKSWQQTIFIFLAWPGILFTNIHKVCSQQSNVTLSLIQKYIYRSIEVMRFIFLFCFFVFFASLQPSWGRRPKRCGVGFKLSNERQKGLIIKISSSSSTTHAKWVKSVTTEFTMIVFCNFNFEGAHRNAFGMGIVAVMSSVQKRKGAS